LRWKFGTPNRSLRNYDEIVSKYQEKLSKIDPNIVSPFSKNMPVVDQNNIGFWLSRMKDLNSNLVKLTNKSSESGLDKTLLPHPLMGKMVLREMLMWNAYHTEHHFNILQLKY
jgi:hypothetical protein